MICMALLAGCSAIVPYPYRVRNAQRAFNDLNTDVAVHALEQADQPDREAVLVGMEKGVFLHTGGDYEKSSFAFMDAVDRMKEYDNRASVSLRDGVAFAAAVLVNDNMRPYRGSGYERVLLHTYLAMNFLLQRNLQDARVEILQAYAKQKEAREENEKTIQRTRSEAEKKKLDSDDILDKVHAAYSDQRGLLKQAGNIYQNVFTYYLSVMVYELTGEIDDAYIDAKTVYSLNPNFEPVRRDLLRYSKRLGVLSDYEKWRREFGNALPEEPPEGHGEVVVLFQCGLSPVKEQIKIAIPINTKDLHGLATVAIPKFKARPNPVQRAVVHEDDRKLAATWPLMDVDAHRRARPVGPGAGHRPAADYPHRRPHGRQRGGP